MQNPTDMLVDFRINERNTNLPFYPSFSYEITAADVVVPNSYLNPLNDSTLRAFSWIQAYFDPSLTAFPPGLAIWSGAYFPKAHPLANQPILSFVAFAYSGERINFKGKLIYASGYDERSNPVTSVPIGNSLTDNLLNVYAYGGIQ